MSSTSSDLPERLLDIDDICRLTGLAQDTIYDQRKRGAPPGALAIKVGRHLRWFPSDVSKWLDSQRRQRRQRNVEHRKGRS